MLSVYIIVTHAFRATRKLYYNITPPKQHKSGNWVLMIPMKRNSILSLFYRCKAFPRRRILKNTSIAICWVCSEDVHINDVPVIKTIFIYTHISINFEAIRVKIILIFQFRLITINWCVSTYVIVLLCYD